MIVARSGENPNPNPFVNKDSSQAAKLILLSGVTVVEYRGQKVRYSLFIVITLAYVYTTFSMSEGSLVSLTTLLRVVLDSFRFNNLIVEC